MSLEKRLRKLEAAAKCKFEKPLPIVFMVSTRKDHEFIEAALSEARQAGRDDHCLIAYSPGWETRKEENRYDDDPLGKLLQGD